MDNQKNKFKYVNVTLSIGLLALLLFQLIYRIGLKINNPVTKIEWFLNEFTSVFAINKDFDITNIAWITLFWITLLFIICYGIYKNKLTKLIFASTLCLINIVLAGGFSQKYIEEISKIIFQNWKAVLICVFSEHPPPLKALYAKNYLIYLVIPNIINKIGITKL